MEEKHDFKFSKTLGFVTIIHVYWKSKFIILKKVGVSYVKNFTKNFDIFVGHIII